MGPGAHKAWGMGMDCGSTELEAEEERDMGEQCLTAWMMSTNDPILGTIRPLLLFANLLFANCPFVKSYVADFLVERDGSRLH